MYFCPLIKTSIVLHLNLLTVGVFDHLRFKLKGLVFLQHKEQGPEDQVW